MPSFPLLDEMLVRSVIFGTLTSRVCPARYRLHSFDDSVCNTRHEARAGTWVRGHDTEDDLQRLPSQRRWEVVDELCTSAHEVLLKLGMAPEEAPAMEVPARSNDETEYAPGTLMPIMLFLYECCQLPQMRARTGMQATARKPSLLMIVHSLQEVVETARRIEQENYTVTVWCASISLHRLSRG